MLTVFVTYHYFLGLRTLTVLQKAVKLVKKSKGIEIDLNHIDYDDRDVLASVGTGRTEGIFQLESAGMRNFMKELKPQSLEDIIAGIALYRPGPMDFIPKYIKGKNSGNEVVYTCPQMEPILKNTYGCIIYQEQVMQIVRDLAGYTLGRSDLVRKAMSKKKADVMEKERKNFVFGNEEEGVKGCVANGISEEVANKVYDEMTDFAKYAFNKAHSTCYAVVAYQTAYLKYYYPVEFMAALMNSVIDNTAKVTEYIMTCKSLGIEILPPDINESETEFVVKDNAIRYGLTALKSVGRNVVDSIVRERNERGPFKNLSDLVERTIEKDVNKRTIESFIKAGALDSFDGNRRQKMLVYVMIVDNIVQSKKKSMAGQMTLFDIADEEMKEDFKIKMPDVPEFKNEELLAFEKEFIGHYVSGHPMEEYQVKWKKHATRKTTDFKLGDEGECNVSDGAKETVGGMITDITIKTTKQNKMMAFFTVEDMYGTVEILVFPSQYEKYRFAIGEEKKVFVKGRVNSSGEEDAKLVCEGITAFEEMPADLWIRFENKEAFEENEAKMLDVVRKYDGNDRLVVYLKNEKQKKIYPPAFNIDANPQLLTSLRKIFGEDNVVLA